MVFSWFDQAERHRALPRRSREAPAARSPRPLSSYVRCRRRVGAWYFGVGQGVQVCGTGLPTILFPLEAREKNKESNNEVVRTASRLRRLPGGHAWKCHFGKCSL